MLFIAMLPTLIVTMIAPDEPAIHASSYASLAERIAAEYPGAQRFPHGRPYVRLSHGLVHTRDSRDRGRRVEFDEGFLFSAAVGQRSPAVFGPVDLDLELELIGSSWEASNSSSSQPIDDIRMGGLLFNATGDWAIIPSIPKLSIYAGAGAGAAGLDIDTDDSAGNFDPEHGPFLAVQARTGVEWRFTPRITANVGLRFLHLGDARVDDQVGNGSFDLETRQQALEAGVRFEL